MSEKKNPNIDRISDLLDKWIRDNPSINDACTKNLAEIDKDIDDIMIAYDEVYDRHIEQESWSKTTSSDNPLKYINTHSMSLGLALITLLLPYLKDKGDYKAIKILLIAANLIAKTWVLSEPIVKFAKESMDEMFDDSVNPEDMN